MDGELNSAQKRKLKNDLLKMGDDEDGEEFGATRDADDDDDDEEDDEDDEDDEEIPQAAATQHNLMMMQK